MESNIPILLSAAPFGVVVRRVNCDVDYLVMSPMDGSGRRVLVTLAAGTLKEQFDGNTWVIVVADRHEPREATHVPLPEGSGELLSATVFSGMLLIACENGAYVRSKKLEKWEKIEV